MLDKLSSYRGGPLNKFDYIYVYIFKGVVGALGGGGVILTIWTSFKAKNSFLWILNIN